MPIAGPPRGQGLFQFIPGTREDPAEVPGARLGERFCRGMHRPPECCQGITPSFDSDLNDLPGEYLHAISRDVQAVGRYLAAAYNCGSKRVERSLRNCTDVWTCVLPEETRIYLRKFDSVWDMRTLLDM